MSTERAVVASVMGSVSVVSMVSVVTVSPCGLVALDVGVSAPDRLELVEFGGEVLDNIQKLCGDGLPHVLGGFECGRRVPGCLLRARRGFGCLRGSFSDEWHEGVGEYFCDRRLRYRSRERRGEFGEFGDR